MKKKILVVLLLAVMLSTFVACMGNEQGKIKIVCTVFAEYDWVREVSGKLFENADVTLLSARGGDLHSFQASVEDLVAISKCDLFIYVGGESDAWVDNALKNPVNENRREICLFDVMDDYLIEEEDEEGVYDEHLWLSLLTAKRVCNKIALELTAIDAKNESVYQANCSEYVQKLDELNEEFKQTVENADKKAFVVCDRFPFVYLAYDYDLDYYAAFPGCSTDTDASFEKVVFLASKVDELGASCVAVTESSDKKIAKTVIDNTNNKNQKIVVLDSMQSVTGAEAQSKKYINTMQSNLQTLVALLNNG